ncbi:transposase, partial [Streptomyces sp. NPDC057743]|uniref:transposase n=1 Tax=Streptomyces sp. NPDC057743 TaxID=3346236 RepID=UPI0036B54596
AALPPSPLQPQPTDVNDQSGPHPGAAPLKKLMELRHARPLLEFHEPQLPLQSRTPRYEGRDRVSLDGRDGLLQRMMKQVIERALQAKMSDRLGYESGAPAGRSSGNNRKGSYGKTVTTTAAPVEIDVPRDRRGEYEPRIVPKGTRRLEKADEAILSLYARGMTTRHPVIQSPTCSDNDDTVARNQRLGTDKP